MQAHSPEVKLPVMEEEVLDFWGKNQIFESSNIRFSLLKSGSYGKNKLRKVFSFYDGPPFANGLPHYGHILGQTLKDVVPRYWYMRGFDVERRFGWDCHGLPVEFEVEKKLNVKGRKDILKLGVEKFNEECRATVFHYAKEWKRTITRLGRWVDWDNQYRTMDLTFMESVWWVFQQLYQKGLVYRDLKIVAYSPRITAVVSNFEANQNYKNVQDPSVFVKFKLRDESCYLLAWTTTPWTLVANLAVAVHPDVAYSKVRVTESGEIFYLATKRLSEVFKTEQDYETISEISGKDLIGKKYEPLFDYYAKHENAFQILSGDFVTLETGTGIVHCAPAFGEEDFQVCKRAKIAIVDPLDDEARYLDDISPYSGLYIKDADKQIIKDLKASGKIWRAETIVHSYPHCDRTEDPLIYRAITTWYVAVEKIKETLIKNNQTINWVPSHLRDGRMGKWLENARDWAISRNRFWGTPIPIWISDRDDKYFEVVGSIEELQKKSGVKATDLHKHYIDHLTWPCPKGGTMRRIPEVFDCWFESGSMPYAQKHYPFENQKEFLESFPADFIAEGQDQTRGWFYTLAILSAALFEKPAFKNVVVNGIVLAADGKKMSKRLQNYTPPDQLLDRFGADSVRLYLINSAVLRGDDLRFSDEGVRDITRTVILPLWNAFSFLTTYAAADGWNPSNSLFMGASSEALKNHDLSELDHWILSRLQTMKRLVHGEMQAYRLYNVVPQLLVFIEELTNWYIRLSRRRFWGSSTEEDEESQNHAGPSGQKNTPFSSQLSPSAVAAYATLSRVLFEFVQVFAPFAPFVSEKIFRGLTENLKGLHESVHLSSMPEVESSWINENLESKMELVRKTTTLGRSLRAKLQIRTRQPLASVLVITRNRSHQSFIEQGTALIRDELNVKEVGFTTDETAYVRLQMRPNLKNLGKRLGKDVNLVRAELEQISSHAERAADFLYKIEKDHKANVAGFELSADDLLIERGPKDHRVIATESGITVLLDTSLSQELINEGLAREFVNRIQKLRKDSGLSVSDRIHLWISCDEIPRKAILAFSNYICTETLAEKIEILASANEIPKHVGHHEISYDVESHHGQMAIARM